MQNIHQVFCFDRWWLKVGVRKVGYDPKSSENISKESWIYDSEITLSCLYPKFDKYETYCAVSKFVRWA